MLNKLYLKNFRNHSELKLKFSSGWSVLQGDNGRGKTNILESIYFLSLLRSFRSARVRDFVKIGEDKFLLMAEILHENNERKVLKIEQQLDSKKRKLSINNQDINKSSEFIKSFRAVIFAPEDRQIVSGTAAFRRKFFDILISLESNQYLNALQSYNNALESRNVILKKRENSEANRKILFPFDSIMAEHAILIMEYRQKYAQIIGEKVAKLWQHNGVFELIYAPKLYAATQDEFLQHLTTNYEKDFFKTHTTSGIHLDDFEFYLNDKLLRTFGSSGQVRLTSLFLKMAEFELSLTHGHEVLALIDDVTGELDQLNLENFFKMLKNAEQAIFTFARPSENQYFKDAEIFYI